MTNATTPRPKRNAQIAGILRFALRKMYGGATTVATRGNDGEWRTLYTYEDVASLLGEFEQAAEHESVSAPTPPISISHDWQPIETAPKDRYILIGQPQVLPDLVHWQPDRPERVLPGGSRHLAIPDGWFAANGSRSRVTRPTHWRECGMVPLPPAPSSQE